MPESVCTNRLTVLGRPAGIKMFSQSPWVTEAGARHVELLEASPGRAAWQFETSEGPPLRWLVHVSQHRPALVFLLHYENQEERFTGLAKAEDGAVKHDRIDY